MSDMRRELKHVDHELNNIKNISKRMTCKHNRRNTEQQDRYSESTGPNNANEGEDGISNDDKDIKSSRNSTCIEQSIHVGIEFKQLFPDYMYFDRKVIQINPDTAEGKMHLVKYNEEYN
eukprot:6185114-Ditylum_brightwellii.AAC.1